MSAVVIAGSMRALTEPMLAAEGGCPTLSGCGSGVGMNSCLRAGLVMGGFSFLVLGLVFLDGPDLTKASSSALRISSNVLRLATGHFPQQLLHLVCGKKSGCPQRRDNLRLPCGIGEGLALRKTGSHEFRFAKR